MLLSSAAACTLQNVHLAQENQCFDGVCGPELQDRCLETPEKMGPRPADACECCCLRKLLHGALDMVFAVLPTPALPVISIGCKGPPLQVVLNDAVALSSAATSCK